MPKAKYDIIYKDLKNKIESEEYSFQEFLPSENTLVTEYSCSRNTIRRAMADLIKEGYVQAIQGKGVVNIFQPVEQSTFKIGGIESFKESAIRNHQVYSTKVVHFQYVIADKKTEKRTGFLEGTELIYIQRIHYFDGKPLIVNHNYFLKELMPELSVEVAEKSIYEYLENTLNMTIVTSKRIMTVEKMNKIDSTYLDLKDYNCLAVVSSQTYNSDGIMFEYTQSRHHPDYFRFIDIATRK
ncbi:trehalose operon repressor [Tyzzerella sp. An114]|uniref:trehalose operon repressor n=1 Tax=Tyzzerella sp. An114 TaxID=1965545 RepID=UPI000B445AD3|nr:trehalose operon repressor [Tyzzerella sp. An114]OUQ57187.1 trehalose operon repressor [Tyzzerella sp. An114]